MKDIRNIAVAGAAPRFMWSNPKVQTSPNNQHGYVRETPPRILGLVASEVPSMGATVLYGKARLSKVQKIKLISLLRLGPLQRTNFPLYYSLTCVLISRTHLDTCCIRKPGKEHCILRPKPSPCIGDVIGSPWPDLSSSIPGLLGVF